MTPQELVTAAQGGDRDAFAELWLRYRPEVYRAVYHRTGNHHLAEDIVSEAFLRAWKRLGGFIWRDKGFAGWIVTIARNLVADHYGAAHTRRSFLHNEFVDADTDRRTDPQQVAEQAAVAEALDAALAALTDDQRQVLALRFGADRSIADTALAMGRQQGAIKAAQHRATTGLRRHPAITALEVAA